MLCAPAFPTPEAACGGVQLAVRAQAERLGIHVDGRWGINRLQQEIAMARL